MATPVDANYIRARAALLDALAALGPLRQAAVLVGAQAVYEHTRDSDAHFAVSPFTFDADVALDPELLVSDPRIPEAMEDAGYALADQPGMYRRKDGAQVDFLVPEAVGGRRGRGADLGVHGNRAARQVRGLEGALVSHRQMTIGTLVPGDNRTCDINVAGPAALLVAKIHKLADRADAPGRDRLRNKDAFDIYRLLRAVDAPRLVIEVRSLLAHETSRAVTTEALSRFPEFFEAPTSTGTQMAVQHVEGLEDSDFIAASLISLGQELIDSIPDNSQ
ncbi:MAG: nucleotidyl transferase AbiEii/AbiGii toxin family protein [Gemmatimonadaceae bacterium]|nr:nucleotidyl transferase AbiEii/AbiGii toxin family protein [Gemmatimonadaceae bacterium]